jgi:predicted SAM-dependent methyltransferase
MKELLKRWLSRYVSDRLIAEVAVEVRVIFASTIPNFLFPWRRRRITQARTRTELSINLGCGPDRIPGWFGVDFLSPSADLQIDFRLGLPFADGSCRFLFCEHVFEHLDRPQLRRVLNECYRIMASGGAVRIIVPSLESYARAYIDNDLNFSKIDIPQLEPPNMTECLNTVFYLPTHRYIHDFSTLTADLQQAGFTDIRRSEQNNSRFAAFGIDCQLEHRRIDSLYVEAVK